MTSSRNEGALDIAAGDLGTGEHSRGPNPTSSNPGAGGGLGGLSAGPRPTGQSRARALAEISDRREPTLGENTLVVQDRDAERVAFKLWSEGRTDDAIAFLEREILLAKDLAWKRNSDASEDRREPRFEAPAPTVIVPPSPRPAEGRRKRLGRGARQGIVVSEPAFSDASAPTTIELAAERVGSASGGTGGSILARYPAGRIGRGPAWIAAIGLVIVGVAAAANIWDNREHAAVAPDVAATAVDAGAPAKAAEASHAVTEAGTASAEAAPADVANSTATPAPAVEAADSSAVAVSTADASDPAGAVAPPPTTPDPAAAAAPETDVTDTAAATPPAGPAVDSAGASTTADAATPGVAVADMEAPIAVEDAAPPPDALDDTAAVDPGEPAPATDAAPRLPRQRPTSRPAAQATASPSPAPVTMTNAAPSPQPSVVDLPRPFYDANGLPKRTTLTPEEYQALLAQGTLYDGYTAPPPTDAVPARRRALLRLLRR